MDTKESLGYLKGLLEGLELDANKKETKAINAVVDVLSNIVEDLDDMTESIGILGEQIDAVDEDLAEVEDFLLGDDECGCDDCCDCNDECGEFEVECPLCKEAFTVDEDTVLNGAVPCPNCGEMLEFEIEEEAEDEEE